MSAQRGRGFHHAAHSLDGDWKRACYLAMGVPYPEEEIPIDDSVVLVNMLDDGADDAMDKSSTATDPWMQTALEIHKNLNKMEDWVCKQDLGSVHLPADEASLIQSTVTSFTATTAHEIETLRTIIASSGGGGNNNNNNNSNNETKDDDINSTNAQYQQHLQGISQILLGRLQRLAQDFGAKQKLRHRAAVGLWQDPLACPLRNIQDDVNGSSDAKAEQDEMDAVLGLDDPATPDQDQRFYPNHHSNPVAPRSNTSVFEEQARHNDRIQQHASNRSRRPKSLFNFGRRRRNTETGADESEENESNWEESTDMPARSLENSSNNSTYEEEPWKAADANTHTSAAQANRHQNGDQLSFLQRDEQETLAALQQEAVLLQRSADNEFDAIKAMEQSMVDVTTIMSQFANLVSEQQEEVQEIHAATKDSKENMEKGQEQLIKAKESTENSKHWTAKGIFAMTLIMLVFHWIRP